MQLSIAKPNSFSIRLFTVVGIVLWGTNSALAQNYPNDNNDRYSERQRNVNVVVYKDCNFRGEARVVRVGDYRKLKTLRIANDSISSIKIPQGYAVTFYQDDRFGEDSATASENIRCLNRQWNDEISSLRVSVNQRDQYGARSNRDNADRRGGQRSYQDYEQSNRHNEDQSYNAHNQNNRNHNGNRDEDGNNRASVNGNNLTNVSYAASKLDYIQNKLWRQTNRRGRTVDFVETSRDRSSVYMQSKNTGERIRVDLFSNDVTIVVRNGQQRKFPIIAMRAGNVATARPTAPVKPAPNRVVHDGCFKYKAYTLGGEGGIRFHGHDGFHRFYTKGHSDKICHDGPLTMEINKTNPLTVVVVEINGQTYRFGRNEKPDAYKNTWYRKKVTLKVHDH